MKRTGNLLLSVADPNNLRLAFWKAQRGKEAKPEVWAFRKRLGQHLQAMRAEILSGTIAGGDYHYFKIYDPKERQICAANFRERVLHHALMNVCHPIFEQYQIFDSYASRPNKGTHAAIKRAEYFTKRHRWFLKMDFKKYFDSIDHLILKKLLYCKIKDNDLLQILFRIIDSYETAPEKGLPIGNLTSQYFANHYLAVADHYAKTSGISYVRYMDDVVAWHQDKQVLLNWGRAYERFCSDTLGLELKQFCLNTSQRGIPFLGYLVLPTQTRLAQKSKRRFLAKLQTYHKNFEENLWNEADYQRHLLPLLAFAENAHTLGFRQQVMRKMNEGNESGFAWR